MLYIGDCHAGVHRHDRLVEIVGIDVRAEGILRAEHERDATGDKTCVTPTGWS